jgi:hypothetical protein
LTLFFIFVFPSHCYLNHFERCQMGCNVCL